MLAVLSKGQGRVAILSFELDRRWSDWPIQSTFLPTMHQCFKWLCRYDSAGSTMLAGDALPSGDAVETPGFANAGPAGQAVAVNVDPQESDPARWTLMSSFEGLRDEGFDRDEAAPTLAAPPSERRGPDMTWWLLAVAGLLAVSELLLANRTYG
jgi:hypothetical protein